MMRFLSTALTIVILLAASTTTMGATIELAGGPYFPLTDKDDIVESGYEYTLSLSAPVQTWLMVALSGGYAHLKTVETITIPHEYSGPDYIYDPANWDLSNISLDARLGWGLELPNRFWFMAGLGWYQISAKGAVNPHTEHPDDIITNTIGVRLGAGGSFALSDRFRLGTVVRYSYTHFNNNDAYSIYLAGVQAQVFLGFEL